MQHDHQFLGDFSAWFCSSVSQTIKELLELKKKKVALFCILQAGSFLHIHDLGPGLERLANYIWQLYLILPSLWDGTATKRAVHEALTNKSISMFAFTSSLCFYYTF